MGLRRKSFIFRFLDFLNKCGFDKSIIGYVEKPDYIKVILMTENYNEKYDLNLREFIERLTGLSISHELDWTPCFFLTEAEQKALEEYILCPDSAILLLKLE